MTIPVATLFGYWKLDETAGNRMDESGNGYNLSTGGTVGYEAAKISNGAVFDPTDGLDYLQHQFSGIPTFDNEKLTVSCWVKVNEVGREQRSFRISYTSLYNRVVEFQQLSANNFRVLFVTSEGTIRYGRGNNIATASLGSWYHLVGRFKATADGCYCDITVNGVIGNLPGSLTGSTKKVLYSPASGAYIVVARGDGGTLYYYKSTIDEIGVWKEYLDDAVVQELYNSGSGVTYPFSSSTKPMFPKMQVGGNLSNWKTVLQVGGNL